MSAATTAAALLAAGALCGCASRGDLVPDGLPDPSESGDDVARMQRDPRPFARPVLVFSGWGDPGVVSLQLVKDLRSVALDTSIAGQQYLTSWTMEDCLESAIAALAKVRPADHDPATGPFELDVVGKSMGGLIARELARYLTGLGDEAPARIVRIYTIATPHRGARLAVLPAIDPKVGAMRPGSPFLEALDAELTAGRAPEIIAYTRTGDWMVGEYNTAPLGGTVRVVPRPVLEFGHLQAGGDPRILSDLMRRLRGEDPVLPDVDPIPAED